MRGVPGRRGRATNQPVVNLLDFVRILFPHKISVSQNLVDFRAVET